MGKVGKKQKLERSGSSKKHKKTGGHGFKSPVIDSELSLASSGHIKKHKKSKTRHNRKITASPAKSRSSSKSSGSSSTSKSRSPSLRSQSPSPVRSSDNKGRMPSKITSTKELSEQQKRSKWESPEFQRKRSSSQSRNRSGERSGGYNRSRQREREVYYHNGDIGGRFDRKRHHEGTKTSDRREQQSGRNRSRDRVGQNRYDDRRNGGDSGGEGVSNKRQSSTDREVVHGDNRRERFDDNRRQGRRGYSHSRSPRRDRNNETNRYRGRDDETHQQQKQYHRGDRQERQERHEPKRRRYYNEDNDDKAYEWGKRSPGEDNAKKRRRDDNDKDNEPPAEKEKINFGLSGALTEDANKVNGVVVKYAEPPEARKPKRHWRLYPFKGETSLPTLHIHRQSCFLVGRDRKVVDLAVDHPSCSKQHAALQYRLVSFQREDGSKGKRVRLYVIDLDSANGTFLNNQKITSRKYYELMERDVIKFGFSSREYVLLHENSKDDQEDDDVYVKDEPEEKPHVSKL